MVRGLVEKLTKAYTDVFSGIDPALTRAGNKRVYNDAKLTDHHALIPLAPLPGNSTEKERKIYELVLKRFGAASYSDCIFEVRAILTKFDEDLIFPTMGRVIIIETLLARSYVRREKRRLQAMQKGVFLIDTLKKVCIQKEKEVFSLSQAGV